MPDELETLMITQTPTAERPLLGLTVLVVEDSLYACEAMRLLCLRSGARIRRADSLKSAHKHLAVYRPRVVIVDLGLPDGSGTDLIRDLAQATPRPGVILGISGDSDARPLAEKAGADGFLSKPIDSLGAFQSAVLEHLPSNLHPPGLRVVTDDKINPDPLALQDDLAHISELLRETQNNRGEIAYVAQFLGGLALLADDNPLATAAHKLGDHWRAGKPINDEIQHIADLVHDRLSRQRSIKPV